MTHPNPFVEQIEAARAEEADKKAKARAVAAQRKQNALADLARKVDEGLRYAAYSLENAVKSHLKEVAHGKAEEGSAGTLSNTIQCASVVTSCYSHCEFDGLFPATTNDMTEEQVRALPGFQVLADKARELHNIHIAVTFVGEKENEPTNPTAEVPDVEWVCTETLQVAFDYLSRQEGEISIHMRDAQQRRESRQDQPEAGARA